MGINLKYKNSKTQEEFEVTGLKTFEELKGAIVLIKDGVERNPYENMMEHVHKNCINDQFSENIALLNEKNNIADNSQNIMRKRLPNISKSFSCPNCLQSVFLEYNDKILFKEPSENGALYAIPNDVIEIESLKEILKDSECSTRKQAFEDLLQIENIDFYNHNGISSSDEKVTCPCCFTTNTIKNFIECYISPYRFGYDVHSDALCKFCGIEEEKIIDSVTD